MYDERGPLHRYNLHGYTELVSHPCVYLRHLLDTIFFIAQLLDLRKSSVVVLWSSPAGR